MATKGNKKRLIDEWEEKRHKPIEKLSYGKYPEEYSKEANKIYDKTEKELSPFVEDLAKQEQADEENEEKRKQAKYGALKKILGR